MRTTAVSDKLTAVKTPSKNKRVIIWAQDHDVRFLGPLPYRWNLKDVIKDAWNPDEPRLFPPKQFGVGWGLNFYVLYRAYKKIKDQVDRVSGDRP